MGHHIFFPSGKRKFGFVIPHRRAETLLTNFFGSVDPPAIRNLTPCAISCLISHQVIHLCSRVPHSTRTVGASHLIRRKDQEKGFFISQSEALAVPRLGRCSTHDFRSFPSHMRYHEGACVRGHATGEIGGLPHYKPLIKTDSGDDHGERLTTPLPHSWRFKQLDLELV